MGNTITTNLAANTALRYLNVNSTSASSSLAKLSSGSRIVKASDDAASLAVGTKLKADVTALKQAAVNASHATSVLQVADGGMARISDILQRMKSLAVQAQSGSISDSERVFLDREFQALLDQIDTVAEQTRFNGVSLLARTADGGVGLTDRTGAFGPTGTIAGVVTDPGVLKDGVIYRLSVDFTLAGPTPGDGDTAKLTLTGSDGSVFTATLTHDSTNGPDLSAVDPDVIVLTDANGNSVRLVGNGSGTLDLSVDNSNLGTFRADVSRSAYSTQIESRSGAFDFSSQDYFRIEPSANALRPDVTYTISSKFEDINNDNNADTGETFTIKLTGSDGSVFSKTFIHGVDSVNLTQLDFSKPIVLESEDGETVTLTGVGSYGSSTYNAVSSAALSGSFTARATTTVQVGVEAGDSIAIRLRSLTTSDLGGTVTDADGNVVERATLADANGSAAGSERANIRTQDAAVLASNIIDRAIAQVNAARAEAGALMSRFEFVQANLATSIENTDAARSVLMDTDVAAEMSRFASAQVLMQANVAMLAQANQLPQNLLRLLQ